MSKIDSLLQVARNNIQGFLQLLISKDKDLFNEESKLYVHFIESSLKRAKNLIKDLLFYSRIGNDPKFEIIDLNEIMDEM